MAEEQLGLDDVLAAAVRRWRLIVGVAVPVMLGVFLYAGSLPTTYTATATIGFEPKVQGTNLPGADTVTLLVPNYIAFIRSAENENKVGADFNVSATDLDKDVNVSQPPATATISIAVTGSSPSSVAGIANELAKSAVDHSADDDNLSGQLLAAATPPSVPAGPRRRLLELGGIIGALLLGALVAATFERGFPRLRTAEDVRSNLGLELLGRLPRTAALKHLGGEALDDAVVGLAVRTLRTQLTHPSDLEGLRVVTVCSAHRREGRSTLTALLAHGLARLDLRVLMIDADSVNHAITDEYLFDGKDLESRNLVSVLSGTVPLVSAIHETGVDNLSVLPTTDSSDFSDLIARRMPDLLRDLRNPARLVQPVQPGSGLGTTPAPVAPTRAFDVVLIDTPALLERDEAALLASLSNGAVLVVDSGRQTAAVKRALATVSAAGGETLGIVLNRATRRSVVSGGQT